MKTQFIKRNKWINIIVLIRYLSFTFLFPCWFNFSFSFCGSHLAFPWHFVLRKQCTVYYIVLLFPWHLWSSIDIGLPGCKGISSCSIRWTHSYISGRKSTSSSSSFLLVCLTVHLRNHCMSFVVGKVLLLYTGKAAGVE